MGAMALGTQNNSPKHRLPANPGYGATLPETVQMPMPIPPNVENSRDTLHAANDLQTLVSTFELQLRGILHQKNNDDLYTYTANRERRLPHDPLIHTMRAVKRAELGLLDQSDIDRARMYLDAQLAAMAEQKLPANGQLSASLLHMLENNLDRLASLLDRSA
jgi:hypothetical protein